MPELNQQQAMRYSRQILLSGFDIDKQEQLLASKVLLVGLGGLGCAAGQYLVSAGIGAVTLVDYDTVEMSNLQRQVLHDESSLGMAKVESAARRLSVLNSACEIEPIAHKLDEQQLLSCAQTHDIIVDCTDNLTTRELLNKVSLRTGRPLVSGAAIRMEGQVSCFIPSDTSPCYGCLSQMFNEPELACVEAGVMSPVVGIIGAMQALETIKILTNYGNNLSGKLMLFDGLSSQWQTFNIPLSRQCPSCHSA